MTLLAVVVEVALAVLAAGGGALVAEQEATATQAKHANKAITRLSARRSKPLISRSPCQVV
ncbi:hypothetical protein AWC15_14015 [Mycobacterium lacus]|nr:hypothetical protein AWC15_14015 [Mycobacterium lacus]